MARAIFYTHHTSGECVNVCACDRTHKIEKIDICKWYASYELQLIFLHPVVHKIFSSVCFTRNYIFYSFDCDVILTWKHKSVKIWFNRNIESRKSVKNFETTVLGLDLQKVGFPYYFIVPESCVLQSKDLRWSTFLHTKTFDKCFNLRW